MDEPRCKPETRGHKARGYGHNAIETA